MNDEFYTKLGIYSHTLEPAQIDAILGIKSDKSYLAGEIIKPSIMRHRSNGWIIYSRLARSVPLEDHVRDLLDRTSSVEDKIRSFADQPGVEVEFGCVVYTRNRPAIYFTKEQTAAICAMGASIDVDLYLLPGDDEEA